MSKVAFGNDVYVYITRVCTQRFDQKLLSSCLFKHHLMGYIEEQIWQPEIEVVSKSISLDYSPEVMIVGICKYQPQIWFVMSCN